MSNKTAISGWMHFNSLGFLEKVLDTKQIQSQVLHENNGSFLTNNKSLGVANEANDDIETIVNEASDDENEYCNNEKSNYDYVKQQQRRLIYQQKMNQNCCPHHVSAGDEIMHFFKSIAPYLALMDPTMKLKARISIQEIILNELSRKHEKNKDSQHNDVKVVIPKRVKKKTDDTFSLPVPKRHSKRVIKRNRKYYEK